MVSKGRAQSVSHVVDVSSIHYQLVQNEFQGSIVLLQVLINPILMIHDLFLSPDLEPPESDSLPGVGLAEPGGRA